MTVWILKSTLLLTAFYAFFMLFMRKTTFFQDSPAGGDGCLHAAAAHKVQHRQHGGNARSVRYRRGTAAAPHCHSGSTRNGKSGGRGNGCQQRLLRLEHAPALGICCREHRCPDILRIVPVQDYQDRQEQSGIPLQGPHGAHARSPSTYHPSASSTI